MFKIGDYVEAIIVNRCGKILSVDSGVDYSPASFRYLILWLPENEASYARYRDVDLQLLTEEEILLKIMKG